MTVAPHCPLGPIALAASLQIDCATSNILIQEQSIAFYGDAFPTYLVDTSVFDLKDGRFKRPTGPASASRSTRSGSKRPASGASNSPRRSSGTTTGPMPRSELRP